MANSSAKSNYDYKKLVVDDPEDPYYVQVGGNNGKEAGGLNETTRLVPWHVIRIPFRHFIKVVISLPLGAFIFCVFWALYTDYDRATTVLCTHDMNKPVRNYLPSLSAAIGDFQPSQQIWKACIIIHAPGRFLFASMYLTYLKKVIVPQNVKWAILACLFHVIEIIGLIGLTVVTSKHNLFVHAVNFGLFVVFSQLYMIILCMLLSGCRKVEMNRLEQRGTNLDVRKECIQFLRCWSIQLSLLISVSMGQLIGTFTIELLSWTFFVLVKCQRISIRGTIKITYSTIALILVLRV
ncbi:post-GPI attachment to proteins factor 2 isoform X2 [Folsomia candida]|uniref:post-GPI attachment to proteins factor 2 isoform X2 n=1 Tax=Folsomia candida TaxID=158441 RepID=UPI000B9013BC|nr:post-GPI attachment to proteins factor 2 isoform X2 [Folsomia candida]